MMGIESAAPPSLTLPHKGGGDSISGLTFSRRHPSPCPPPARGGGVDSSLSTPVFFAVSFATLSFVLANLIPSPLVGEG